MTENLIVPINLQALCIGNPDINPNTKLIKPEIDFSNLPYIGGKSWGNISENILSKPFIDNDKGLSATDVGVHVHWALPDVLTKGENVITNNSTSTLSFPILPNRWLVMRMALDTNKQVINSNSKYWIVESDYLSTTPNNNGISVPYQNTAANPQPYRFMGRFVDGTSWKEQGTSGGIERFDNFNVLLFGSLSFASFYPNCHSIFGFHDSLTDITQPTDLTYTVIGWYSNKQQDFLKTIRQQNLDAWLTTVGWQIANKAESSLDVTNAVSLYSGSVINVQWNPNKQFITNPSFQAQVAFAHTPTEALSAFLAQPSQVGSSTITEDFLNALQLGMLNDLAQLNGINQVDQSLHAKRFQHSYGGRLYVISKTASEIGNQKGQIENVATMLPPNLATALIQLNNTQQTCNSLNYAITSLRWQIFSDWYKYMVKLYDDRTSFGPQKQYNYASISNFIYNSSPNDSNKDEIKTLNQNLQKAQNIKDLVNNQVTALKDLISQENTILTQNNAKYIFELSSIAAPMYYSPADPAILLVNNTDPSYFLYAGERNQTANNILTCRLTSQILSLAGVANNFITNSNIPFLQDINALLNEALILSSNNNTPSGIVPEPLATQNWKDNFWLPLKLEWEVTYLRTARSAGAQGTNEFSSQHILNNFVFGSFDNELRNKQNTLVFSHYDSDDEDIATYQGEVILTPHIRDSLINTISSYLKTTTDENLKKDLTHIQSYLASVQWLSQTLDGFTKALIMRKKTLQLTVSDPFESSLQSPFTPVVNVAVGNKVTSEAPQPNLPFNPIQDGIAYISGLRIIDIFGRFQDIIGQNLNPKIVYPSTYPTIPVEQYTAVQLYTRIAQGCRLSFSFLSADNGVRLVDSIHPASNPICGWVLANNLDNSLMFYDAQGKLIGELISNDTIVEWQSAPIRYPYSTDMSTSFKGNNPQIQGGNLQLYNFAQAIIKNGISYLQALISIIDTASITIEPESAMYGVSNIALMSRPLALVQAVIGLELQGLPAFNESWDSLSQDIANSNDPNFSYLSRTTDGFDNVLFPIKLGDHANFQDGLIGYFVQDDTQGISYMNFCTTVPPASGYSGSNIIANPTILLNPQSVGSSSDNPPHTSTSSNQNIAMLLDPRTGVNAISGILPVTQIKLPEELYVDALQSIYVTFFTGPILTNSTITDTTINIPVPKENGLIWSYIEAVNATNTSWQSMPVANTNKNDIFSGTQRASDGWLQVGSTDTRSPHSSSNEVDS